MSLSATHGSSREKPGRFWLFAMQSRFAGICLVLLSLFGTFLVVEVAFRIFDMRGFFAPQTRRWAHALLPRKELVPGVHIQFRPYTEIVFRYDSNPRGYFDAKNSLTYRTNRYGFRGADFPRNKPEGAFRIMVLGDSFTFGEGVKLEHIFTTRLQDILKNRTVPNIGVLNFGTSAWSTRDEIAYFEHAGRDFQPDLVLVVFVLNDAGPEVLDLWNNFRASYEAPFPFKRSYVASFVYAMIARENAGRRYINTLVNSALAEEGKWRDILALLPKGKRLAESVGARFAVVAFPFMYQLNENYPFHPIHKLVRDTCEGAQIPYLDLFPAFKGQSYMDLWVHPSDQHPNEKGHAIAARAIADFLIDQRLLARQDSRGPSAVSGVGP